MPLISALLDMHAADEHGVGPGELLAAGRPDVLVDEAHLPASGR